LKAIIVAAGPGSRLNRLTRDKPKCLLKVGGQTIMERTLGALRANGIEDISVVRGWQSHLIDFPGLTYYHNPDFRDNNILVSLFYAEEAMTDDFVFSYSDIIYTEEAIARLLRSEADVAAVVDVNWAEQYVERDQHPISEAELVKTVDGRIVKIGKEEVTPEEAHGEFVGLVKFTIAGAELMKVAYHHASENHDRPFHHAASLRKAYMTDMLQELVDRGIRMDSVDIEGGWSEIDTPQDLAKAQHQFENSG